MYVLYIYIYDPSKFIFLQWEIQHVWTNGYVMLIVTATSLWWAAVRNWLWQWYFRASSRGAKAGRPSREFCGEFCRTSNEYAVVTKLVQLANSCVPTLLSFEHFGSRNRQQEARGFFLHHAILVMYTRWCHWWWWSLKSLKSWIGKCILGLVAACLTRSTLSWLFFGKKSEALCRVRWPSNKSQEHHSILCSISKWWLLIQLHNG